MNKRMTISFLIILLSYINGPFFFVGITAIHRLFYYAISVLPMFLALYRGIKKNELTSNFYYLLFFYTICVILVSLITFSLDLQYFIAYVRMLLNIFGTVSVFFLYEKAMRRNKINMSYQLLVVKSTIFYVLGTILFICIPPLKTFWSSIILNFKEVDFTDFVEYITRYGFAGFSGFTFAFLVSATSVSFCYLYLNGEIDKKKSGRYLILLLLGSFFYGRIGFVATLIVFALLTLYECRHKNFRLFNFFIIILFLVIVSGIILYFSIPDIQPFIDWLLEPLFNYIDTGKMESASTNGLKSFYENFHPDDKTLLMGDGYWIGTDGKYYGHTDVGFMRNIYYGGVFYTGIQYLLVIAIIFFIGICIKKQNKKGCFLIPFMMFIVFLLFEIKGDIALWFVKQYLPILLAFTYDLRKEKENDFYNSTSL